MRRIKFNFPSVKPTEWEREFERAFEDFLKQLNEPETKIISPVNPNTYILFKSNGGVAIFVDGALKSEWNP